MPVSQHDAFSACLAAAPKVSQGGLAAGLAGQSGTIVGPGGTPMMLRKSCDLCVRLKRACDGKNPCHLCLRR